MTNNKRFWFYNDCEFGREPDESLRDWARKVFLGSDEYGHHTLVIPLGKGRAACIAYRAGYKGFRKCQCCVESRKETLDFEQEAMYVQTYWNVEHYDDVFDLDNKRWYEALGV